MAVKIVVSVMTVYSVHITTLSIHICFINVKGKIKNIFMTVIFIPINFFSQV